MAGFRSYFPRADLKPGDLVELDAAESRHLLKALRARTGDAVTLFDGRGLAWSGRIEGTGRNAEIRIEATCPVPGPTPIHLGIAMLKGKAMDAVIRAAVELGVAAIIPLETEHTEVRLDADRAESKVAHWRTIAIEAAKQCGNLSGLDIPTPRPLTDWLLEPRSGVQLVASLMPGAVPLLAALENPPASFTLLIGPEGDFSPGEYLLLTESGFRAISLGRHVLRAETAATYALSVLHAACWMGY